MAELREAVMFESAFASMRRMLGPRLTPALRAQIRAAGVDFEKLEPAYPLAVWEKVMLCVVAAIYPAREKEAGCRQFGREFIHTFVNTPVGAAALVMGRVIGPRRTLARMDRNFRTATNSSRVTTSDVGPRLVDVEIALMPEFVPAWRGKWLSLWSHRAGILAGTLEALGAQPTVEILERDVEQQRARYRVSWS